MKKQWYESKIDEKEMKSLKNKKSHEKKRREVLKGIVEWRKKATAPEVKLTATQRRKQAKLEKEKQKQEDADHFSILNNIEPTSSYGSRRIPSCLKIIAIKYAIEEIRRIHHLHHAKKKKKDGSGGGGGVHTGGAYGGFYFDDDDNNDDNNDGGNDDSDSDSDDGYMMSSKKESDDESELFSLDDLKSVMRRDTSALEEMTSAKLKKQMREQGCKFPVFKLATNLTLERMQCLMVVAGATAASCSLLSKMNTPLTKDLTIRCRKKMKEILMLSGKRNFLNQLKYFCPHKVNVWAKVEAAPASSTSL